jgi:hypothetical protein
MLPNIFDTSVEEVKRLLAVSCRRFEAICHRNHYKGTLKKPLMKGREVIAPEFFKSETLSAPANRNKRLFS